jgi:hypothetical protein
VLGSASSAHSEYGSTYRVLTWYSHGTPGYCAPCHARQSLTGSAWHSQRLCGMALSSANTGLLTAYYSQGIAGQSKGSPQYYSWGTPWYYSRGTPRYYSLRPSRALCAEQFSVRSRSFYSVSSTHAVLQGTPGYSRRPLCKGTRNRVLTGTSALGGT